jgi:hypothetical protein
VLGAVEEELGCSGLTDEEDLGCSGLTDEDDLGCSGLTDEEDTGCSGTIVEDDAGGTGVSELEISGSSPPWIGSVGCVMALPDRSVIVPSG